MKVFIRKINYNYTYPDDMKKILDYLESVGTILVKESTIESLYYEFSDQKYSAGWMSVDDLLLEEFATWLEDYDI